MINQEDKSEIAHIVAQTILTMQSNGVLAAAKAPREPFHLDPQATLKGSHRVGHAIGSNSGKAVGCVGALGIGFAAGLVQGVVGEVVGLGKAIASPVQNKFQELREKSQEAADRDAREKAVYVEREVPTEVIITNAAGSPVGRSASVPA